MFIIRFLYCIATLLLSIVILPLFLFSARGRARLTERYGFWNLSHPNLVWFHGASLGEVNSLLPIIESYKKKNPNDQLLLTATSLTGLERGADRVDFVRMLPFDNPLYLNLALRGNKFKAFIFAETELWPELLLYLRSQKVPSLMVNAKISDFTFSKYKRFAYVFKNALRSLSFVCAVNDEAVGRFEALGVEANQIKPLGNAKYDVMPTITDEQKRDELHRRFFPNKLPVLVLGSLRPGEEDWWLDAVQGALKSDQALNIVLAPRHQERFDYFANKLRERSLEFDKWSEVKRSYNAEYRSKPAKVMLLDTIGDLEAVYSFADVAFIGGSIVDFGGHNPLEAAAYGACIALGPHVKNIRDVASALEKRGALVKIRERNDVDHLLLSLCTKTASLREMGQAGKSVWRESSGATARIVSKIDEVLNGF